MDLPSHLDFSLPNTTICHFPKYTPAQLEQIFSKKLTSCSAELFHPKALQLLIGKAGTETDIRKAFQLIQKVTTTFQSQLGSGKIDLDKTGDHPISISLVNTIIKPLLETQNRMTDLPMSYKHVLVALSNCAEITKERDISFPYLFSQYKSVCKQLTIKPETEVGFSRILESMNDLALVQTKLPKTSKRSTAPKIKSLCSCVTTEELLHPASQIPKILLDKMLSRK